MQHRLLLGATTAFEVAGTTSSKLSHRLSRLLPSILVFVFYALSLVALSLSLEKIDVSVAFLICRVVGFNLADAGY